MMFFLFFFFYKEFIHLNTILFKNSDLGPLVSVIVLENCLFFLPFFFVVTAVVCCGCISSISLVYVALNADDSCLMVLFIRKT